ncbi:LPXTG cell wall anchor domain-containing protein [Turicibacter sanguinis]|jgi:LPXTG-motif cell wall anchor domain protein|nr:LPXTG cell wall anchor domain-containing protein [Turicibacter sanguinis]MTP48538.1 LPXTG cell wall anchor domain-containing protein [Turicibacter sanguinis]MTP51227.1 LPXTG cell wall anchor domain-containing protein [Turicibacter sanguinis]MTQ08478.1 LPXTG cell wall anchor domain-containing protein [Turicibacter sanguinis]
MVFANDTVEGNLTSSQFLSGSNENGVIKLSGNVTLSDSLKIDAKNYVIDLNGHTLTLTKDTNLFTNNANVTFKNGTINLDGIKGNADTILGVGNYGSSATLTLDAVNLQANNYKSPYALIYVYNNSTLNIENNSVLNAKNEKSLSGGVIKSSDGQAGKINITDSTLNFENAARGFVDGTINIKNSTVNMKGLANGINSSTGGLNLAVDNSEITITGSIGRALTVDGTNIKVKNNSALNLSNSLGDDILFKSEGKIEVDQSSQLNFKTIKLDESIKGTDLNNLIVSENYEYQLDEQGNLIITEKQHDTENNPGNETDIPQTGDDSNLYLMIGMAITSLTGLVYLKKTSSRKDTV